LNNSVQQLSNTRFHAAVSRRLAPRAARKSPLAAVLAAAILLAAAASASATTKGLNQIVTPDVQPVGQLSLSYQQQDPFIGNPSQVQYELGFTPRFEVALLAGLDPGAQVLETELGVIQKAPYLLSTGFLNWSTRGSAPQPYLEGGYYFKRHELMAGAIRVGNQTETILGYGYQAFPRLLLQLDYQSGNENSATAGFNYSITPALQLNPAIYISNSSPHAVHGYAVLTWNVQLFK